MGRNRLSIVEGILGAKGKKERWKGEAGERKSRILERCGRAHGSQHDSAGSVHMEQNKKEEREEEEEEGLFNANPVNEEDSERDRATPA